MSLQQAVLALTIFATSALLAPSALSAQTPTADTSTASSLDSQPSLGDSAVNTAAGGDTVRGLPSSDSASADSSVALGDSASSGDTASAGNSTPSDTLQSAMDTVNPAETKDTTKVAASVAPPADSILTVACDASGSTTSIAPDLLVVVFAEETGPRERAAAAQSVKGKLIGEAEPGAYYIRIPSGGGEVGLRIAADQLSLHPQVREVGSRACPPRTRDTAS